jgi:hypothetical protein
MTIAAATWPDALVQVSWIVTGGVVAAVLVWSIFRTGQTAIRNEGGQRELVERLRREIAELRNELRKPASSPPTEGWRAPGG